jgi:hypothetical protein
MGGIQLQELMVRPGFADAGPASLYYHQTIRKMKNGRASGEKVIFSAEPALGILDTAEYPSIGRL